MNLVAAYTIAKAGIDDCETSDLRPNARVTGPRTPATERIRVSPTRFHTLVNGR